MRKLLLLFIAAVLFSLSSCKDGKQNSENAPQDTVEVAGNDTTIYGICCDGTSMNSLEMSTSDNDTLTFSILSDSIFSPVKGGMMPGDRMAVTAHENEGDKIADKVINLTTLLGKWTSIDKNFEIKEGGIVKSIITENNKYVSWEINNGRLILSPDTFDIYELGADSLMLENQNGIYVFARIKN